MLEEHRENFFTELLKFALLAVIIVVPVRLFIAEPFIVSGSSMVPTFQNGQYLIVDELTYHFEQPERGDIIVFQAPQEPPGTYYIKRIIGLPGDTVMMSPTSISVKKADGSIVTLNESYVVNQGNGPAKNYVVAPGDYFVMGDNRPESSDSRYWGLVPQGNIVGRVLLRLLPPQSIGLFPGHAVEPQ